MSSVKLSTVLSARSYALDLTEGQPQGHAARSCLLGMRIAAQLQLSAGERSDLFYALLMKDAGCSSNAARVSQLFGGDDQAAKRGLWDRDWRKWREKILARVPVFSEFAYDASCHHERIDGKGYHRGVPGDGLSMAARIMAAADIFDALSAARPYRGALPLDQVMKIIQEGRGTQLCPATVDALLVVTSRSTQISPA